MTLELAISQLTYHSVSLYVVMYGLYLDCIVYLLYIISCNIYLKILRIVYNVFHYYINKRKRICKVKHVQGITLTCLY